MKAARPAAEPTEWVRRMHEMYPDAGCELQYRNTFELLVAVVLSAQTTDKSVNQTTPELFQIYPDAAALAVAEPADVERILRRIGMYRTKAAGLIKLSGQLLHDHRGEVPGDYDQLMRLAGVGRKTANVVLAEGFGEQRIAVDTHVLRLAGRMGFSREKDPLKTETALMCLLPEEEWTFMHHALIHHGRRVCTARKPDCAHCGVADLCPKIGVAHG